MTEFKAIRERCGGTFNDVVLTIVISRVPKICGGAQGEHSERCCDWWSRSMCAVPAMSVNWEIESRLCPCRTAGH